VILTICLVIANHEVFADNTNSVKIQNIQVQPSTIKVGDPIRITVTLVNNSTDPIFVGDMGSKDCQGPFFTVVFDNHVKVTGKEIACSYVALEERLDPGKKNTGTSPGLSFTYAATESGTANATVIFPYTVKNQTDPTQPNIEQNMSKSFQFLIHDINETYAQKPPVYFASPLQQIKAGVSAQNVKCGVNFSLIIKSEDGSPACVKPDTAQKLTEGGWALTRLTIDGLKEIYGVGEKIDFMIDFQGLLHYCGYPHVSVLDSNQNIVWKSQDVNSMCVSAPFSPLPYVNQNFDLNSGYGGPITINKTGDYTMKVSLYGNSAEKGFIVK
jgi:hypothetical protein